jgi:V/A-type H+-transporting ATPase subunit D
MPTLNVNPTRMEMKRLKGRLKTDVRGHKLLKDKTDEMVRQFVLLAKKNRTLRLSVEKKLTEALQNFTLARSLTDSRVVGEAILIPAKTVTLSTSRRNLMNVSVPVITAESDTDSTGYPYSMLTVTEQLDGAIDAMKAVLLEVIELAEVEKTCNMLADEIEKNKRRVNALENIMIPQMEETIKYIKMKLDENERSATVRLMKVKDLIAGK